ncbi:ArsR/SmtB family transcription factor [Dietzia sp. 179-F 9C3 NHS]|uniref:ArsR/SmtB family transcription factor n=1 Tax=Dietzia sp. 179-F 9C3 NHS TaxID=3374295 RepID=UPI003879ACB9
MRPGPDPTIDPESADDVHHCAHEAAPVPLPPVPVVEAAGELLRALSAPLRIGIVLQLREGPRCVHELVDALGVAQPLVSQHLRVLKTSKVVAAHRQGREIRYELIDDHLLSIVEAAVVHAAEDRP